MPHQVVDIDYQEEILSVTLNRPEKRNALHGDSIQQLSAIFKTLANKPNTKVIVLRGEGDCFCSGGDIAWMYQMSTSDRATNQQDALCLADCFYQLYHLPIPTIALAHGMTLGGGMGLLCACDMVVASDDAVFGFPEIHIGLTPATISPYVVNVLGSRVALYYFLTGKRFLAAEAQAWGLVQQIVPRDQLLLAGQTLATQLSTNDLTILKEMKQLIRHVQTEGITERIRALTAAQLSTLRALPMVQSKLKAFIEKK